MDFKEANLADPYLMKAQNQLKSKISRQQIYISSLQVLHSIDFQLNTHEVKDFFLDFRHLIH